LLGIYLVLLVVTWACAIAAIALHRVARVH
jgi:hypothetical protein